MGRRRSRSPSSRHKSSSYKRDYRQRSRSIERDSKSSRDSRSTSKYSSSKKSRYSSRSRSPARHGSSKGSSKYQSSSSSRRRHRSSSSSSSSSSESSYSRKSASPEKTKAVVKAEEPAADEMIFDSVNFLHDKDKKLDLDDLDTDSFVQKSFTSNKKPDLGTIVVDLDAQSMLVPKASSRPIEDSLLHHELFGDDERRMEKWVKKLFSFRQRCRE